MEAGFAEIDITPPLGTLKIGWKKVIVGEKVIDPLFARIAVFDAAFSQTGFIQLDLLSVRWTMVNHIRELIQDRYGFPGENIMISATHNHAGPAVSNTGDVPRDETYTSDLIEKCISAFGEALNNREQCRIGLGSGIETGLAFNRRMIMRDGTVKTQQHMSPEALCLEGPADPAVGLLAVKNTNGDILGCMVNFTCHPTHHGGEEVFSAGYPGVMASVMKERGCPVTLYMNGASGNIIHHDFMNRIAYSKETVGGRLADRVTILLSELDWQQELSISSAVQTLHLPYREVTAEEKDGTVRGAQRFVDTAIYEREIPGVCEKIKQRQSNPAEIQVVNMGEHVWVAIPAEYFVEHGLRIKEEVFPKRAWIVGQANGMVGYVPTREAFRRGGYETTFCGSSRLSPEAGDMLADGAIGLVKRLSTK